jgi:ATP-dependent Clp protease ATP-binding subunit ClpC
MSYPKLDMHANYILKAVAQEIAYEFGLDYVGNEHILLAILRHNQGIGAKVLHHFQVGEDRAREQVEEVLKKDMEDTWVFGRLPGSPHYRNVMAIAIDEATQLESRQIASEHLLLALLRERGSTAARVLEAMGVTLPTARAETLRQIAKTRPHGEPPADHN